MRQLYCIIIGCFVFAIPALARSVEQCPVDRFNELVSEGKLDEAKTLLDTWPKKGRKSGDYYASQFNYYLNQSLHSGIQMATSLPLYAYGTDVMTIQDTINGGVAGYLYQGYAIVDSARMDSAIYWINVGIEKCPNRLDLYLGLASFYLYCDQSDNMLSTLERAMCHERKNKGRWLWTMDEPVSEKSILVLRVQEDYARYIEAENLEGAETLTKLALKYYPTQCEYINNMAVIRYMQEDYAGAMSYFKMALQQNPDDEIIQGNIQYLEQLINAGNPENEQ